MKDIATRQDFIDAGYQQQNQSAMNDDLTYDSFWSKNVNGKWIYIMVKFDKHGYARGNIVSFANGKVKTHFS